MTTTYPDAVDSYTTKVDNVTQVLAAHVNDLQDAMVAVETDLISKAPNPNLLYHSLSHDIWPDGTTFNDVTDDSYVAGLWNALWDSNAPDVSGIGGGVSSNRILKCLFDANGQAGFVQFLTNADTVRLRGKTISFSVYADGHNVTKMRCAILGWTGTADAVTSDVVATWAAGNPTLATNWEYMGTTPADQSIPVVTRILAEGITVPDDATINNLAVFVWTPEVEASTDYFTLQLAKLEIGLTATAFLAKSPLEELLQVQHFCYVMDASNNVLDLGFGRKSAATTIVIAVPLPVTMRAAPALTHNISGYTAGAPTTTTIASLNQSASAFFAITGALTVASGAANKNNARIDLTAGTSWDGTVGNIASLRVGPDVIMVFSARL